MKKRIITLTVNGRRHELLLAPNRILLEVVREELGLIGTKFGCELGECGLCTVLVDGTPTLSCVTLAATCEGHEVTTIEGLAGEAFDIVQRVFAEEGASQCGYCTPSMALMLTYLLEREDASDPRDALAGNICRCTGYTKILKAYERAIEIARK